MMMRVLVVLGLSFWALPLFAQSNRLTLIIPAQPSPVVTRAAEEVAYYVERMGNPRPVIVRGGTEGDLFFGVYPPSVTEAEKQGILSSIQKPRNQDAFVVHSVGRSLVIDGNSPRAVLYGAYEYLETLGVRWYFPGTENEVVPKRHPAVEGYNLVRIPSFRKRGVVTFSHRVIFSVHPENYEEPGFREFVAFAAHKKLNTIAVHHDFNLEEASSIAAEYGLDTQQEIHFFGEHFCPDDAEALRRESARFEAYLAKASATMRQFFLWPDDENLPDCSSPQFRDYRVSDLTLNFSNEMNKLLQSRRPGAEFAFISYLRTWDPPRHVKPDPGVTLEWAPMNQSLGQALNDPNSPVNARMRNQLEQYLKLFPASTAQVLGYWLDDTLTSRTDLGHLLFRPSALQQELRYYRSLGIANVTSFGIFAKKDGFSSNAPPVVFLYPELLWDPDTNVEARLREYCKYYFGDESAFDVLAALQKMDGIVYVEDSTVKIQEQQLPEFGELLTTALSNATRLMEQQTDETYRSRLAKLVVEVASRANYRRPIK